MEAIILGKKIVGRWETLKYASEKFGWQDVIIGVSCFYGFWAWVLAKILRKQVIYYCIDFYSPEIAENLWDRVFIWSAMKMDRFLVRHCDKVWDISDRINEGRLEYGGYEAKAPLLVPMAYPPHIFQIRGSFEQKRAIFVGCSPYGLELWNGTMPLPLVWLGKGCLLPQEELLEEIAKSAIGISLWKNKGNNYYGDPGKTKLYSACGIPVIMTDNTPYAKIIKGTKAGLVIPYGKTALKNAVIKILSNYKFYKNNVKKTWEYIDANIILKGVL